MGIYVVLYLHVIALHIDNSGNKFRTTNGGDFISPFSKMDCLLILSLFLFSAVKNSVEIAFDQLRAFYGRDYNTCETNLFITNNYCIMWYKRAGAGVPSARHQSTLCNMGAPPARVKVVNERVPCRRKTLKAWGVYNYLRRREGSRALYPRSNAETRLTEYLPTVVPTLLGAGLGERKGLVHTASACVNPSMQSST